MEVYTWSCNSLCSSWKNPRRALVLCIEVDGGKNMCCCQIIITGHCWTNKRLASQEERAMIRNNISQNWWIYYRVTKLTAFCEPYFITWSMTSLLQMIEWFIFFKIFLSPLSLHTGLTPASWGQQWWSPALDQARMSQESTRSSIRHVFSGWRPRPNWRWPDAATRVCVASSRLTTHGFPGQHWVPLQWRCVHAMGWHWPGDTGGDKMYAEHHGAWIIFKWCALNFKTTQNQNKFRCLHPIYPCSSASN